MKQKNDKDILEFIEELGIELYPWQKELLIEMATHRRRRYFSIRKGVTVINPAVITQLLREDNTR